MMKLITILMVLGMFTGCATSPELGTIPIKKELRGMVLEDVYHCLSWTGNWDKECVERKEEEFKKDKITKTDEYIKKNPKQARFKEDVMRGYVDIGMAEELMLISYGNPKRVNTTFTKRGVYKQYVYLYEYVYTMNGYITTIQKNY